MSIVPFTSLQVTVVLCHDREGLYVNEFMEFISERRYSPSGFISSYTHDNFNCVVLFAISWSGHD